VCEQEEELRQAVAMYRDSLADVAAALAAAPDDVALLEVRTELEAALEASQDALTGMQAHHSAATGPAPPASPERAPAAAGPAPAPAPPHAPRGAAGLGGNNARIHPRSVYAAAEPDFAALAREHPSLRPHLLHPRGGGGRPSLDFGSAPACRELTRVLLRHDFGVEWWVPEGQLVPPLTNRANYIHWLQDLLALSSPPDGGGGAAPAGAAGGRRVDAAAGRDRDDGGGGGSGGRQLEESSASGGGGVLGLDIGCGANLIYPLLGAALCGWRFVGVDVTEEALQWAGRNRDSNPRLAPLLEVRRGAMQPAQRAFLAAAAAAGGGAGPGAAAAAASAPPADEEPGGGAEGGGIISGALLPGERFHFCMCNPPFFGSMAEAGRNPATAYGGTPAEMVFPGGEAAFVGGMVADSAALRGRVHWYTTMVGKKATLKAARAALYRAGVAVVRTTEFSQGKTSRWGLAWSYAAHPSTANKPLPRFPAARAAAPAGEAAAPPRPRKVGATMSVQVAAPAAAGGDILAAVHVALVNEGLECSVDAAAFTLRAHAGGGAGSGGEAPAAKRAKHAGAAGAAPSWSCDLRLFMLHPGAFMLTGSLGKGAPAAAIERYSEVMGAVQAALAHRWKAT
jgi:23S rRNA (adenine1618-N6)-methyltransferase